MDRRRKQIELYRQEKDLREIKFDVNKKNKEKGFELNEVQNELYKRYKFYQKLNNAIAKR